MAGQSFHQLLRNDYNKTWVQAWPLTPTYGAISGYIIGSLVSLTFNMVGQFVLEQS